MEAKEKAIVEQTIIDGRVILRVKGSTPVSQLAGSIMKSLEQGYDVETQTIGPSALNQAIKAIAKARGYVAQRGRDLVVRPGFGNTVIDGEERTTIVNFCSIN